MTKRKTRSKKPQKERANNPVIDKEKLEEAGKTLRDKHPDITDRQHELVVALLQDGCTITEAAKRINGHRAWATTTLNKQHVLEYQKDMALAAIGTHALRATATMSSLLNARSEKVRQEAAKDLMDRAGLGTENKAEAAGSLTINISV
jgi:hypothetical protein